MLMGKEPMKNIFGEKFNFLSPIQKGIFFSLFK